MKADGRTETEVMASLQAFADCWAEWNMDGFLDLFAPDADVVVFGSGADEQRLGRAEIREQLIRDWSQLESLTVEFGWHSVSAAGPVAWVATELVLHAVMDDGVEKSFRGRLTAVLEKRAGRWIWMQSHFSLPVGEAAASHALPAHVGSPQVA
jgi:uncharacterized protein (TIGR02246 family)